MSMTENALDFASITVETSQGETVKIALSEIHLIDRNTLLGVLTRVVSIHVAENELEKILLDAAATPDVIEGVMGMKRLLLRVKAAAPAATD